MFTVLDKAFIQNRWVFVHALGGVYFYLVLKSILFVLAIAIIWELIEILYYGKERIVKIYGNMLNFIYDAFGDIVAAVVAALIAGLLS